MGRHFFRLSSVAGLAAAMTFGAAAVAGAQQTDSARAAQDSVRRDSLARVDSIARADSIRRAHRRATSSMRIPVSKEQRLSRSRTNTRDTVTSAGAIDTTTFRRDTINQMGRDTLGARTDTSALGRDTTTFGRDTTGLMRRDTTGLMGRDTTGAMGRDTLMARDTTMRDTTMMGRDTTGMMRTDTTGVRSDTAVVQSNGQVSTSTDTTFYGMSDRRSLGHGLYIGVQGGAAVPTGNADDIYKTGFNVDVPLGWQSLTTPWGLRLDGSYNQLTGDSFSATGVSSFDAANAKLWAGMLDLTLKFPNGQARNGFYVMGGGGVHHFTDLVRSVTFDTDPVTGTTSATIHSQNDTKFGWNAGAGISFGIGAADLYVESRFVSIMTDGNSTNYVPIALGVRFF
jgi:hypothetical protein